MYVVRHWEALQDVPNIRYLSIWGHLTNVIINMLMYVLIIINYANSNIIEKVQKSFIVYMQM